MILSTFLRKKRILHWTNQSQQKQKGLPNRNVHLPTVISHPSPISFRFEPLETVLEISAQKEDDFNTKRNTHIIIIIIFKNQPQSCQTETSQHQKLA